MRKKYAHLLQYAKIISTFAPQKVTRLVKQILK